ncbi:MAG TPA: hypothetical protein VK499_02315 [Propionibacteriaceae bacterium]|jgi:hypothetical protein|nr:hypothetical protein [Propionibacteriaceae bacterium]
MATMLGLRYGGARRGARDACGLEPDEAIGVMRWAAEGLLQVAVSEST